MLTVRRSSVVAISLVAALTASGATAAAAGEEAKPPTQILSDVAGNLAKLHSLHLSGTQTDPGGRTTLAADVTSSGRTHLWLTVRSTHAELVILGPRTYVKANAAYWKATTGGATPEVISRLAGRWIQMPTPPELRASAKDLTPKLLGYCVTRDNGTIVKRGTRAVGGQRLIVLADRGDRPGTSAGLLYVRASGPTLPVRAVQTGRQRPGGHNDPRCNDPRSTTTSSDLRFSRFDAPMSISAPADAIDITLALGSAA